MSTKPSMYQIATSRELWDQYVDANGNDQGEFDEMSVEAKINMQCSMWPDEYAAELRQMAEAIYSIVSGADNRDEHDALVSEIYDWLVDGMTITNQTAEEMAGMWQAYQDEATEDYEDYE